jgi:hypothetical protein
VKKLTGKNFDKTIDFKGKLCYTVIVKGRGSQKKKTPVGFNWRLDKKKFLKQEKTP